MEVIDTDSKNKTCEWGMNEDRESWAGVDKRERDSGGK